jgi:hypothetical protein
MARFSAAASRRLDVSPGHVDDIGILFFCKYVIV